MNNMQFIENKTFDEIEVGQTAELVRTVKRQDIELFAVMSGDVNPAHVDEEFARSDLFHKVIAHGMWGGALISAVLGTELPGPGTIYLNQSLSFRRPVGLGDTVTVRVTVREKKPENKRLVFDCVCVNQDGETVIKGEAEVIAPTEKVRRPRALLPEVKLRMIRSKDRGGVFRIRTERRYGRIVRRADGKVLRFETGVIRIQPVPKDQQGYGVGFEQRHAQREGSQPQTAPVLKAADPSR